MTFADRLFARLVARLLSGYWKQLRAALATQFIPGSGGIVFLGDSLTAGGHWDLLFPQLPTRNFGIGGERSDHILMRLEPVIRLAPSKLFLLIGSNDLNHGASVEQIASNVERILDELRKALPDCVLHLQSVLPRQVRYTAKIAELNRRYKDIAHARGVTYIDLFPLFDDGTGALRSALTKDKLHLRGEGYVIWRDALAPHVSG